MERISPNFWFGSRRPAGRNTDPAAIVNRTLRVGFGALGPQPRLAEIREITCMRSFRERRNSVETHFIECACETLASPRHSLARQLHGKELQSLFTACRGLQTSA